MSVRASVDASEPGRAAQALRSLVVAPIWLYRTLISPALGPRCRYAPSCSCYAEDAIRRYGVVRGVVLAAWRVLRCNPFSRGGFDPVEAQRIFGRDRRGSGGRRATMSGGG